MLDVKIIKYLKTISHLYYVNGFDTASLNILGITVYKKVHILLANLTSICQIQNIIMLQYYKTNFTNQSHHYVSSCCVCLVALPPYLQNNIEYNVTMAYIYMSPYIHITANYIVYVQQGRRSRSGQSGYSWTSLGAHQTCKSSILLWLNIMFTNKHIGTYKHNRSSLCCRSLLGKCMRKYIRSLSANEIY